MDKAPFRFTGTIEGVDCELAPQKLSTEDETTLHKMKTAFAGAHE